jgi:hypothetical protein
MIVQVLAEWDRSPAVSIEGAVAREGGRDRERTLELLDIAGRGTPRTSCTVPWPASRVRRICARSRRRHPLGCSPGHPCRGVCSPRPPRPPPEAAPSPRSCVRSSVARSCTRSRTPFPCAVPPPKRRFTLVMSGTPGAGPSGAVAGAVAGAGEGRAEDPRRSHGMSGSGQIEAPASYHTGLVLLKSRTSDGLSDLGYYNYKRERRGSRGEALMTALLSDG